MNLLPVLLTFLKFVQVENRMIPKNHILKTRTVEVPERYAINPTDESALETVLRDQIASAIIGGRMTNEKVITLKGSDEKETDEYDIDFDKKHLEDKKKETCAIVVLSNVQNPNMQSLIRKYRYDANGALIPSSVQYFIKLPQGLGIAPVLVPLKDKAFSPLGGFVRYYKEVPPIPQAW